MNDTSDVIIIGGGVIGLSAARRLQAGGASVCLLEKGRCGREASSSSAGLITPSSPHRRGPVQALMNASVAMYGDFCSALASETGVDPGYRRCGYIEVHFDEQRHRMSESEVRAASGQCTAAGEPVLEMLSMNQARQLESAITAEALSAKLCRLSGHVHPPSLLEALMASCRAGGVDLREGQMVRDFIVEGNRVTGVVTDLGTLRAGCVVLCAGAWSASVDVRVAGPVPTHPVRGQTVLLDVSGCPDARCTRIIESKGSNKIYLVFRSDDTVLAGATVEPEAGFDRRNTAAGISLLTQNALRLVPGLAQAGVVQFDAGLRPGTPDARPIIGRVPGMDGLIAATGHYRSGVTLAPITADIVADLVFHGKTDADLSLCSPGRFA